MHIVSQFHFTVNCPNKSTTGNVNGGWYTSSIAHGSDPINCSKGLTIGCFLSHESITAFCNCAPTHSTLSTNTGFRFPTLLDFLNQGKITSVDWSSSTVSGPVELEILLSATHWQNCTIHATRCCRVNHWLRLSISLLKPAWLSSDALSFSLHLCFNFTYAVKICWNSHFRVTVWYFFIGYKTWPTLLCLPKEFRSSQTIDVDKKVSEVLSHMKRHWQG